MSDQLTALFILLGEVALIFFILIIILFLRALIRRRKDKALVRELVEKIKQSESDRREKVLGLLGEVYGLQGEEIEQGIETLLTNEKALYSNVIRSFIGLDRARITHIPDDVQVLTQSYHALAIGAGKNMGSSSSAASDVSAATDESMAEIKRQNETLKKEISSLQNEVKAAQHRMEDMIKEYAASFVGGHESESPDDQRPEPSDGHEPESLDNQETNTDLDEDLDDGFEKIS